MRFAVETPRPDRPNRYIDWRYQTTLPDPSTETWCAVLVSVKEPDLPNNLQGLQDQALSANAPLRMPGFERRRLQALIEGAPSQVDESARRFFVYLPETEVYCTGKYRSHPCFDIVFAGPTIEGFGAGAAPRTQPPAGAGAHDPAAPGGETRGHLTAVPDDAVAIGVIDDGLAFAHERFRRRDKSTRLRGLWLQAAETAHGPVDVDAGLRYEGARLSEVDKRLRGMRDVDVYRDPAIGQLDFSSQRHKPLAFRRAHGTHVMDLACGYDAETEDRDDRPILAVQLPPGVTADTSGLKLAPHFLQALRSILQWADDLDERLPLVINFSYGFTAGPKDGTHIIEREIDAMVDARNQRGAPTIVVLPAGNNFESRTTAMVSLEQGQSLDLTWVIPPDDETDNFLEIYVDAVSGMDAAKPSVGVALTPPSGTPILHAPEVAGDLQVLSDGNRPVAGIYFDNREDRASGQHFFLAVNRTRDRTGRTRPAASGRWRLTLTGRAAEATRVRLFIQRDDTPTGYRKRGRQSTFDHPSAYERDRATGAYDQLGEPSGTAMAPLTHSATLSAIANGEKTIVVGAAEDLSGFPPPSYASRDGFPPAAYTSSGPTETRDGPDLSAVVDPSSALRGSLAAGTLTGSVLAMSGTSAAAPQVTKRIAKHLAGWHARHPAGGPFDPKAFLDDFLRTAMPLAEPDPQLGRAIVRRKRPDHIPRRKYPATS